MATPKSILDDHHPEMCEEDLARIENYEGLYEGGEEFEERIQEYLPKRPAEEADHYEFRCRTAHYVPYAGQIVDYFVTWLFTGRVEYRTKDSPIASDVHEPPEWFASFKADVDTLGTGLSEFLRDRMCDAMVKRRSWMLVDFPSTDTPPETLADFRARGLDRGYLVALDFEDVIDWEVDENGSLLWAMIKRRDRRRSNPLAGRNMITDSWTLYTRDTWTRWKVTYEQGHEPKPDDIIPVDAEGPIGTPGRVPLVHVCVPKGLWVMNRLYSAALEQLRARNALSWSLHRTCHANRLFFLEGDMAEAPIAGPAVGMVFGKNERVEWDAPPADAFTPFAAYVAETKDEVYRIAGQMALSVNNNAAAIGRSGESKGVDVKLGEIVLRAFGEIVKAVAKDVLDLISIGRGESNVWVVGGMDTFTDPDEQATVDAAAGFDTLAIPSRRARIMIHQKVVRALLRGATQEQLDEIDQEIEKGTTDEEMTAVRNKARGILPGMDDPDAADETPGEEQSDPNEPAEPPEPAPKKPAKKKQPTKKTAKKGR